jgi:hypothetical protein
VLTQTIGDISSLSRFSTSEFFRAKLKTVFQYRFFSREAIYSLCPYHLLRQQDMAKWTPTKEKGRFARKNSLVENQ